MTKKVRLGIVGLGVQGSVYAGLISDGMVPNLELGAICDGRPATRQLVESKYSAAAFYDDYLRMLDSGTVDAVVICVPSYLHPEMGIDALQHGVHVLLEKPAGIYTKQVEALNVIAATKPELTFAIMFNQRNNPLYRRIKEIVSSGAIGEIRHTSWIITTWWRPQAYYGQAAWRGTWGGEGGGVLVNQAPHQLDLWLWICGLPRSVYAKVAYGFRRAIAVEDEATAIVDYGQGATGVFITATHDLVGTDRFEILGDSGKIVIENSATATVTRLTKPERELSDGMDREDTAKLLSGRLSLSDYSSSEVIESESQWGLQHAGMLENFAANILDDAPLIAPGVEGINSVRLANAIHLSSWTGQEVPFDFNDDDYLAELNSRIRDEGLFQQRA
jgi:UDP-N-acetyl-2-amino-2-deoxyglucuronate dehydrogenase